MDTLFKVFTVLSWFVGVPTAVGALLMVVSLMFVDRTSRDLEVSMKALLFYFFCGVLPWSWLVVRYSQ